MKNLILFALVVFGSISLTAQGELKSNEAVGQFIEGKKIGKEKMVFRLASENQPWENQRKFEFVEMKAHEKGKLKGKDWNKVKIKDIDGYTFNGREFVKEKYVALGTSSKAGNVNKFTEKAAMIGAAARSTHFMERIVDGEVEVYKFYNYPPDASVTVGADQAAELDALEADLRTNYEILIKSGKKGKVTNFKMTNVEKLIAECPEVVQRYENEEFKLKPKGGSKLMKMVLPGKQIEERVVELVSAYNECMK